MPPGAVSLVLPRRPGAELGRTGLERRLLEAEGLFFSIEGGDLEREKDIFSSKLGGGALLLVKAMPSFRS